MYDPEVNKAINQLLERQWGMPHPKQLDPHALGIWVPCAMAMLGCEDLWCKRHGMHVRECACPPAEDWPCV